MRWLQEDFLQPLDYRTKVWGTKELKMNALDFGGCQIRPRVFVVAKLEDDVAAQPEGKAKPQTLRQVIGHLSEAEALADGVEPMSKKWTEQVSMIEPGGRLQPKSNNLRLEWEGQCHSLRTGPRIKKNMVSVHPEKNRFLSVREFCHIMGVPEYRFPKGMAVNEKYRIIGQAIPPFLATAVIDQLTA